MANANEVYAFVTDQGWLDHLSGRFPYAVNVGADYRMIQFARSDEAAMVQFAEALGFSVKHHSAIDTITAMEARSVGPFIVYGGDVHGVVDHFNSDNSDGSVVGLGPS